MRQVERINTSYYNSYFVNGNKYDELLIWFNVGSLNELTPYYGIVHLFEHLICKLEFDGMLFSEFLTNNNISIELKTSLDSMYVYLRGSQGTLDDNLELIFRFILQGEIYEIDLQKEKKIIANEKISRKFDNIKFYQDELNKLLWREQINADILGNNLGVISLFDVKVLISELLKKEHMSIYYSTVDTSKSKLFFSNLTYDSGEINCKQLSTYAPLLKNFFLEGSRSSQIQGNPGVMGSIIYMLSDDISERYAIILSLISIALVNGTSGYLFDKLRNNSYNLYFVISRIYFIFSFPFLEIQYIYNSKQISEINNLNKIIIDLIKSEEFVAYIKSNLSKLKINLTDVIEYQLKSDSLKNFLIFLARENQKGREEINLNSTKEIIDSITDTDLIQVLNEVLTTKNVQIFLV